MNTTNLTQAVRFSKISTIERILTTMKPTKVELAEARKIAILNERQASENGDLPGIQQAVEVFEMVNTAYLEA